MAYDEIGSEVPSSTGHLQAVNLHDNVNIPNETKSLDGLAAHASVNGLNHAVNTPSIDDKKASVAVAEYTQASETSIPQDVTTGVDSHGVESGNVLKDEKETAQISPEPESAPSNLNGNNKSQESDQVAVPKSISDPANEPPAEGTKPSKEHEASPKEDTAKVAGAPGSKPSQLAQPLKVIIVGAGIGGLTAATSLRHAGHDVKIFESSTFSNEVGAAIHLGPNATRLLSKLNYDPARLHGVDCLGFTMYDSTGKPLVQISNAHIMDAYKSPWYLVHRVDLHNELKRLALDAEGSGTPAQLFLSSTVTQVDEEQGIITLQNGDNHQGDLIIAADGIHSRIREMLFDPEKPVPTGTAAYRFLVESDEICGVSDCLPMEKGDGRCRVIFGSDKRVVIYPCRRSKLMNFVCMHPSDVKDETSKGWNSTATAEQVVETYKDFSPLVVNMLKKASNVKCWQLLQRSVIPSWVKGRVCLIGDSAHPMLPHQGQGGGQAMEDGACLGPLFTLGTKRDNVNEVLQIYEQVRHARATKIQWLSATQYVGKEGLDPNVTQKWTFEHDVTDFARLSRSARLII